MPKTDLVFVLPDRTLFSATTTAAIHAGETLILQDKGVFKIEEIGWFQAKKTFKRFAILSEIEGENIPPSGRYDWE